MAAPLLLVLVLGGCSEDQPAPQEDSELPLIIEPLTLPDNRRAMQGTSRLIAITSCAELTDALAPVLTSEHVLTNDEVQNLGYPNSVAPYSFNCTFEVPDKQHDRIMISGHIGHDNDTRDELLEYYPQAREFGAEAAASEPYRNVVFLEADGNYPLAGNFHMYLVAMSPSQSVRTGSVGMTYHFGDGSSSQPYNGMTQSMIERSRGVPDDDSIVQALLGLTEPN
ncbi:MAG: hypothetical protein ACK4VV_02210 [Pseudomonas sp.]